MSNGYVSATDFKRLEQKVNRLLVIHELDSMLTGEEKRLVDGVKADIKNKRKDAFASIGNI